MAKVHTYIQVKVPALLKQSFGTLLRESSSRLDSSLHSGELLGLHTRLELT